MISNYIARKRDGFVSVNKQDDKLQATKRRFDELTGNEVEPDIEELDIDRLKAEKAIRENQVLELDALIKDLEKTLGVTYAR